MTTYTVDEGKPLYPFRLFQRWMLAGVLILVSYLVAVTYLFFDQIKPLLPLILGVVLILILAVISLFARLRKIQAAWASGEIELGEDYVIQRQPDKPQIRIHRDDITRIVEKWGLIIHTDNRSGVIYIPANLARFEEAKSRLAEWKPVEAPSLTYYVRLLAFPLMLTIGNVVFIILLLVLRTAWPVLGVLLLMAGRIVYIGWITWQRQDLTLRAKRLRTGYYSILFTFFLSAFVYLLLHLVN